MWNWIGRLRVWAMREIWLPTTTGVSIRSFGFHYKSGGQLFRDQAIPWNAEDLAVEAVLHGGSRRGVQATDLVLRLESGETYFCESLRADGESSACRACFRIPVPHEPIVVQLFHRNWTLGQINLPVVSKQRFLAELECRTPTAHVRLAGRYVACRSFVAAQSRGVLASLILASPWSLTPLLEMGLRLEIYNADGELVGEEHPGLTSSVLANQEAVILAAVSIPRKKGNWRLDWMLGQDCIASQDLLALSLPQFLAQLQVSNMQFLIESASGNRQLKTKLPRLVEKDRLGPCFSLMSGIPGAAGIVRLRVNALITKGKTPPLLAKEEHVITDGPTLVLPGTLDGAELEALAGFELRLGRKCLGTLLVHPAPQAQFDSEGSFQAVDAFAWDGRAEDELNERLSALTHLRGESSGASIG